MLETSSEWTLQITEFDRLIRELDIIDNILKSQFKIFDTVNLFEFPYPIMLDKQGNCGHDGKYIYLHNIWTLQQFLNLPHYKKYYSERFEKSNNNTLLNNEIKEVLEKAEKTRDFYNNNLANQNEILGEFIQYNDNQEFAGYKDYEQLILWQQEHEAEVFISNYIIDQICYGVAKWQHHEKYKFHYKSSNHELASFCQDVIDFFSQFEIKNKYSVTPKLESIFNPEHNGFEVCKGLLEDAGITLNSVPVIKKWAGKLIGVIHAISTTSNMLTTDYSKDFLLKIFNEYLNTDFKTGNEKRSRGFKEGFDDAKRYIKIHFK